MINKWIGIDPGKNSGNIAVIADDYYEYFAFKTTTLHDMFLFLSGHSQQSTCVVERVWGHPGMNTKAVTSLVLNRGHVEAMLTATGCEWKDITPSTWMKHFNMKKEKSETKAQWKNRLRDLAERRMPLAPITRENADAFLIALYNKETT
jgi:hypothetical protein